MLRLATRAFRLVFAVFGAVIGAILLYMAATIAGAVIPADPAPPSETVQLAALGPVGTRNDRQPRELVYLLTTTLHADFAIPVDDAIRARFAFLADAGVPIGSPDLKFLVFGWGSRAFYTQTPRLSDIRPGPTLRAITGDRSVMHVMAAGDVRGLSQALAVSLPPGGLARLVEFIELGFSRDAGGGFRPVRAGYGMADAFFASGGHFDIFRPCNIWVAEGLRAAGVSTGRWTPTTHSLKLGLSLHAGDALSGRSDAGAM